MQTLTFEPSSGATPRLSLGETRRLVGQAEEAGALLALMLTSSHIGPLREGAAGWALRMKGVQETLDTWLHVQELWASLGVVFSNPATCQVGEGDGVASP